MPIHRCTPPKREPAYGCRGLPEAAVSLAFGEVNLKDFMQHVCSKSANTLLSSNGTMATVSDNPLHNRHSDVSSDQAAALQDIARNGAADEGNLYGFNDVGSHGHQNSMPPQVQFRTPKAYLIPRPV